VAGGSCRRRHSGAGRDDLDAAAAQLKALWQEIDNDIHRQDAALPGRLAAAAPASPPRIRLVEHRLSIQCALRRGADITAVLLSCAVALGGGGGSDGRQGSLQLRVAEGGAARVLHLQPQGAEGKESWEAQIFVPLIGSHSQLNLPEVEIFKHGKLSAQDLEAIRPILLAANTITASSAALHPRAGQADGRGEMTIQRRGPGQSPPMPPAEDEGDDFGSAAANSAAAKLRSMGAQVFPAGNKSGAPLSWAELAGYEAQKAVIEETLLLALQRPEVYERIARSTRAAFVSNRPRAVLFEGPPGTGKTTSGRIIASQAAVPMVYIPLEAVMSKYYGESERLLAQAFSAAEALGGCIVFLDEIDSLATTRGGDMHEATRRLLGVLLRQLDGFDGGKRSVVIAATNRKQDLDPALRSRFDAAVRFGLPDEPSRAQILAQYARHLSPPDLAALAAATGGFSGRDLRDVCEQAERRWASKIIRGDVGEDMLPGVSDYQEMAQRRREEGA